ncbi:MAG: hypothetical protein KIS68_11765 [Bauldia sp.]|nr:hypothetical protein [Bauldia sp.]
MSQKHLPLSVFGEVVGDVVEGDHAVNFYSVRPALGPLDGRSFASLSELKGSIEQVLRPLRTA